MKAQGLVKRRPKDALLEVVRDLVGVNAQLPSAMALSLRARLKGLTLEDLETCRIQDRRVVRTWCMRGTLHLVQTEDLDWLLAAVSPAVLRGAWRWLEKRGGLNEERARQALEAACRILQKEGPLPRGELMEAVTGQLGFPVQQAAAGIVHLNGLLGRICFGPDRGAHSTYAALDRWLGRKVTFGEPPDHAALARRFLQGYGPAAPQDLAAWWDLGLKQAKSAWAALGDELVECRVHADGAAEQRVWKLASQAVPAAEPGEHGPSVRLLPAFDTYWLGYADRAFAVPPRYHDRIFHGGEIVPTILVDGCAAGTWRYEARGKGVDITVSPFTPIPGEIGDGIAEEAQDVWRFLGLTPKVRFNEPL